MDKNQIVNRGLKLKLGLWEDAKAALNGMITMSAALRVYLEAIVFGVIDPVQLRKQVDELKEVE